MRWENQAKLMGKPISLSGIGQNQDLPIIRLSVSCPTTQDYLNASTECILRGIMSASNLEINSHLKPLPDVQSVTNMGVAALR